MTSVLSPNEHELLRLNRALKAIIAVSQTMTHAETEPLFLEDVCRILHDVGGYRLAWVGVPESAPEKIIRPVAWVGEDRGYLHKEKIFWDDARPECGPACTAIATGATTVMHDILRDGVLSERWRREAVSLGLASIIGIPLRRDDEVFGAIMLYADQVDAFDTEEVKLLEQLAVDIAFGISTLRDREEHRRAESALGETEERYRLLVEHSPEAILVHCDWILEYVNPAAVRLFNASSADELIGKPFLDFVPVEFRDEIVQRACQLQNEKQNHGGLYLTYVSDSGEKMYYESVGAVTMYNGRPATQIVIRDITERKRAEEELERSREELRQLAAHLQSARENERTSIAREIHDELGQDLTGLKMDLALLEDMIIEHLPPPVPAEITGRITSMSELLNATVQSVRKIISELRPVLLDKLGLNAAIEWQAEEFQNRTGIACDCFITADDSAFARDCATAVYRIFQESLTNVLRHAEATRVSVTFSKEDDLYELEIRDNGRGIETDAAAKPKSFGLLGMRERALLFNGNVTVEGALNKGTTVRLTIPESGLKASAEALSPVHDTFNE